MKKQTAVEWLLKKLNQEIDYIPLNKWDVISDIIQEALAMERHQHGQTWDAAIRAHESRGHVYARSMCDFDDYEIGS
jgi:hypothetical protein